MENYKKTPDSGEVRSLQERLERGTAQLTYEAKHGYLLSLLRALNVPTSSQLLVASKTSPNKALISPQNPRALYYNDRVSIAYVPAADLIEIAAADPQLGVAVFRRLGSPRRRAADIAIGVTAAATGAVLLTRNARDFAGIPDLDLEAVS
jgi:predicted nucleic acid-binding protein